MVFTNYRSGSIAGATACIFGYITVGTNDLEKSAKLTGDLCHQTLSIEAGAFIEGNLSHQNNAGNSTTAPIGNATKVVSANATSDVKTPAQKKIF